MNAEVDKDLNDAVVGVIDDLEMAARAAIDQADALQAELNAVNGQLGYTPEEQAIMDHILAARAGIKELGLRANCKELDDGVHRLQMFVVAHVMQRLGFRGMSRWYWSVEEGRPPS